MNRHRANTLTALLLLLTLNLGCGRSRDLSLSRSAALRVLNSSANFTPAGPDFNLTNQQVTCGLKSGLWVPGKRKSFAMFSRSGPPYVLTTKGRSVISKIAPNEWSPSGAEATLIERRRTGIDITGISDIEWDYYKGKQVDFIWHWNENDMPEPLRACFPAALSARKGTAYFRLYDDGWRVERLERQAEGVL